MYLQRRRIAIAGLIALVTLAGCAKRAPTLLDNLDDPQMSREELRASLYNYVIRFSAEIEEAGYYITRESGNIAMSRPALYWMSSAVPTVQTAAFQSDPGAALIDVWAFCVQQQMFFEEGLGRDVFGDYQYLAVEAARGVTDDVEEIARELTSEEEFERMRGRVREWASANPVDNILLARKSTVPLTTATLGPMPSGTFSAVGNMAEEVRDLTARMNVYAELIPKQARWQAALLMTAESEGVSIMEMLRNIETHAAGMEAIVEFLDSTQALIDTLPGLISSERQAVMNDITRERIAVMREINALLALTLEAIDRERQAVMSGITEERIAALQDIDALAERLTEMTLDQAEIRIESAIDHLVWRLAQLFAVVAVLAAIAGFFVIRYVAPRWA